MIYPQKRIHAFSPASGKPSVNKVMKITRVWMSVMMTKVKSYHTTMKM